MDQGVHDMLLLGMSVCKKNQMNDLNIIIWCKNQENVDCAVK